MLLKSLADRAARPARARVRERKISRQADSSAHSKKVVEAQDSREIVPAPESAYDNMITSVVSMMDSSPTEVRDYRSEYTHVSSIVNPNCMRKLLLGSRDNMPVYRPWMKSSDKILWAMGRACEAHIRSQFITARAKKGIYGVWSCVCGVTSRTGYYSSCVCDKCGKDADVYGEYRVENHEVMLSGQIDLLVQLANERLVVVETKSMNKDEFDKLEAPVPAHILQALAYRRLLIETGFNMADEVCIVYASKGYVFKGSVYKEFCVNTGSTSLTSFMRVVDTMWDIARDTAEHRRNRTLPDRVCSHVGDTKAKQCHKVAECFSRSV